MRGVTKVIYGGWLVVVMCFTAVSACRADSPGGEDAKKGLSYWGSDPYAALPVAQEQRKLILVEFYASWNHRSRWMSERVLGDSTIRALIEPNFIAVQVPTETPKGAEMAEVYQVTGYPAIVIFDASGNVLDKIDVTLDVEDFERRIEIILMTTQGVGTWRLNAVYEAVEAVDSEGVDAAMAMFLEGQLPRDVVNVVVWPLFENSVVNRYGSVAFDYLIAYIDLFRKEIGNKQVDRVLQEVMQKAMLPYVVGNMSCDRKKELGDIVRLAEDMGLSMNILESMSNVATLRNEQDLTLYIERMALLMDVVTEVFQLPLVLSLEVVAERGTRKQKSEALEIVNDIDPSIESRANMVLLEFLSDRLK